MRQVFNGYKQSSPKLSNCITLHHQIDSLEGIEQFQEKCYGVCKMHQIGGQITY